MKPTAFAFLTFTLSICLTVDSQYVPKTCQCPQVTKRVKGPFSDFSVILKGPTCLKDEIIVTLQRNNRQVCLSPNDKQGKRLMMCWQRNGKDSKRCLRKLQKKRPNKRRQIKSKKGS